MQTLGAIRIQLYHQCFEQVCQHNFTSIIGLRRSTQRHRSSKVDTSIFEGRHIDLRRLKAETSYQHRADIPTIRHQILSTTALHMERRCGQYSVTNCRCDVGLSVRCFHLRSSKIDDRRSMRRSMVDDRWSMVDGRRSMIDDR